MLIGQMRSYIRSKHKDVRANQSVIRDLYIWLKTVAKPVGGKRVNSEDGDASPTEDGEISAKRIRRGTSVDEDYYDHSMSRGGGRPTTRQGP